MDYTYYITTVLNTESYNIDNGTITLRDGVEFNDEVYVTYAYQERFATYQGYYDSAIQRFIYLDLNPSDGHTCTSKVITNDQVVYQEVPTKSLVDRTIYLYMTPLYRYNASDGSVLSYNKYNIRHCFGKDEMRVIRNADPSIIIIATVQIKDLYKVEDAIVLDTRTRGGGLVESLTNEQIDSRYPGARHYWDISNFNGVPYQANGAVIMTIPQQVLVQYGGKFTEEDVERIVNDFKAEGTYILIEYASEPVYEETSDYEGEV
jgi:hypothetical protein